MKLRQKFFLVALCCAFNISKGDAKNPNLVMQEDSRKNQVRQGARFQPKRARRSAETVSPAVVLPMFALMMATHADPADARGHGGGHGRGRGRGHGAKGGGPRYSQVHGHLPGRHCDGSSIKNKEKPYNVFPSQGGLWYKSEHSHATREELSAALVRRVDAFDGGHPFHRGSYVCQDQGPVSVISLLPIRAEKADSWTRSFSSPIVQFPDCVSFRQNGTQPAMGTFMDNGHTYFLYLNKDVPYIYGREAGNHTNALSEVTARRVRQAAGFPLTLRCDEISGGSTLESQGGTALLVTFGGLWVQRLLRGH